MYTYTFTYIHSFHTLYQIEAVPHAVPLKNKCKESEKKLGFVSRERMSLRCCGNNSVTLKSMRYSHDERQRIVGHHSAPLKAEAKCLLHNSAKKIRRLLCITVSSRRRRLADVRQKTDVSSTIPHSAGIYSAEGCCLLDMSALTCHVLLRSRGRSHHGHGE